MLKADCDAGGRIAAADQCRAQTPLGDEQEPMNPYEPPRTEPPLLESDEPQEAQLAYHHPTWQRVLALGVPFSAGGLAMLGMDSAGVHPTAAIFYFGLAAVMLAIAWRWTR